MVFEGKIAFYWWEQRTINTLKSSAGWVSSYGPLPRGSYCMEDFFFFFPCTGKSLGSGSGTISYDFYGTDLTVTKIIFDSPIHVPVPRRHVAEAPTSPVKYFNRYHPSDFFFGVSRKRKFAFYPVLYVHEFTYYVHRFIIIVAK